MAYHKCLAKSLMAIVTVLAESASALYVVSTDLNFIYFWSISFHYVFNISYNHHSIDRLARFYNY